MESDLYFYLREVVEDDLPIFFEQQLDPDANYMAAFTSKDPTDREAFTAHWNEILSDATVIVRTIVFEGSVVGDVLSYEESGKPEVSYWIGKEYWGQGIATRALSDFLAQVDERRPMYARAARDNIGSLRVLQKCGFRISGESRGFANARAEQEDCVAALMAERARRGGHEEEDCVAKTARRDGYKGARRDGTEEETASRRALAETDIRGLAEAGIRRRTAPLRLGKNRSC